MVRSLEAFPSPNYSRSRAVPAGHRVRSLRPTIAGSAGARSRSEPGCAGLRSESDEECSSPTRGGWLTGVDRGIHWIPLPLALLAETLECAP